MVEHVEASDVLLDAGFLSWSAQATAMQKFCTLSISVESNDTYPLLILKDLFLLSERQLNASKCTNLVEEPAKRKTKLPGVAQKVR